MKTVKYFIQEKCNHQWVQWYGTVNDGELNEEFMPADFSGFDDITEADDFLSKITKLQGDEFRIVELTTLVTCKEVYYKAF